LVAKLQDGAAAERLRLDVVADAGTGTASPVKLLAGVDRARRRHVRGGGVALGRDGVAGDDDPAPRLVADQVRFRKVGIEGVVAGVLYLDPDRARVDVAFSRPERHTRVPGAVGFVDHPHYAAIHVDEIMCRNLRLRIGQPAYRRLAVDGCRVVQE